MKIAGGGIRKRMKLAALYSGGKDSTYAMQLMEQQGHTVDTLVSIVPLDPHSWLFHTPNMHLMPLIAQALGKRSIVTESSGSEEGDLRALRNILVGLDVDGLVTGAVASDYQWDRMNGVCEALGLRVFSPLWRKEQEMLMRDLIASGIRAIIVAVQAEGLGAEWLGRRLDQTALAELIKISRSKGINLSGEGGEYETLVLDSSFHERPIEVLREERKVSRDGGTLTIKEAKLGGRKA